MTTYLSIDNVVYNENDTQAVFTISVIGEVAASDIVIDLQRATPSAANIYVTSLGSVTLAAGATQVQFSVPLTNLTSPGFMVRLSTQAEGVVLTENRAVAVVQDGATAVATSPTFTARDVVVDEGNGTVTIQYMLDAPSATEVSLSYATHSLTAFAGEDFGGASGTITIAAGQTHGNLVLPLYTDGQVEGREVFAVSFGNPAGVTIEDPIVHVAIADQDAAGGPVARPSVHVFGSVAYEDAGYAEFVIALDRPSTGEVQVDYDTNPVSPPAGTPGQAVEGVDYVRHSGTVVFAPGEVLKTVRVLLLDNPNSGSTTQFQKFWVSLSVFGADHEVSNTHVTMLNREYYAANAEPATLTIAQLIASEAGVVVTGTEHADVLVGGLGPDLLNGRGGADSMTGGLGDDTYIVDQVGDVVTEQSGEGRDTVITYLDGPRTLADNVENLVLASLTDMSVSATGNSAANLLIGNVGNNRLEGLGGNDTLDGGAGIDTLIGGSGSDVYVVDSRDDVVTELPNQGNDTIRSRITYDLNWVSNVENLALEGSANIDATGDAGANVLTGNAGNNRLDGAGSNDTIHAGAGHDTLIGGDGNDQLYGGDGNDTQEGGEGNDVLDGSTGSDSMRGGLGDDVYYVDSAQDAVVEAAGEGNDKLYTTVNYTLSAGSEVETMLLRGTATKLTGNELGNTLVGGELADLLYGMAGNDTLVGGAGNEVLDGGTGVDSMRGGLGDDVYFVESVLDVAVELAGEGNDKLYTTVDYTLRAGSEVETMFLRGAATKLTGNELGNTLVGGVLDDQLYGKAGNDTLIGGAGNDLMDGGSEADSMRGGLGDDVYFVGSAQDAVVELAGEGNDKLYATVNYTLRVGSEVETMFLRGTATQLRGNELVNTLVGGELDDQLYGLEGNDTLIGGVGNDVLDGGTGSDSMRGGVGDDVYYVDSAQDAVIELAGEGNDKLYTTENYTLRSGSEVETIFLRGAASRLTGNELGNTLVGGERDDVLNGMAGNDTLVGATGNDTLDGGVGGDSMRGGAGDDVYLVDSLQDEVVELTGEGYDKLYATANHTLRAGSEVEAIFLRGAATQLTGNELANTLVGGELDDQLSGMAGNDTLIGGAGNDTLVGGVGSDALTGGAGNDTFAFDTALNESTDVDRITDFAAGDVILLDNDIFTALGAAGAMSASQFYSGAGITGAAAGQTAGVYYNTSTGALYYEADGFGGVAAVQFASLITKPTFTAASFVIGE